jgi:predicted TIM-barrel fold metal-dependent hydrolase
MKKIDIHCHTTKRKLKDIIPQSAFLDEIVSEMKIHEIERTVVLATYFPHRQSGTSNFRLSYWIKDKPEFYMFGSLDFEHYYFQGFNELEELSEAGLIKGIKLYTCYQEIDLHSDKMQKIVDLAAKHQLPVMFHSGYSYSTMRTLGRLSISAPVTPADLEFLMRKNAGVNFIISHLSKPFLPELIRVASANRNVYSDMSGLIDSKYDREEIPDAADDVRRFVGECGPQKLLFGTDFPVQTHEDSIHFIEEAMKGYSLKNKEDVYYNNAKRLIR